VNFPAPRDDIKAGPRIPSIERKPVIAYFVKGDDVVFSNILNGGRDWEAFFPDDKIEDGEGRNKIKIMEFYSLTL